jgi:hypothetical protein
MERAKWVERFGFEPLFIYLRLPACVCVNMREKPLAPIRTQSKFHVLYENMSADATGVRLHRG